MFNFKKEVFFSFFFSLGLFLLIPITPAKAAELDLMEKEKTIDFQLPFTYYEREPNDKFTLIHQGGYKIYDLEKDLHEVAVIGPLLDSICITITDGEKLIVFHKHISNAIEPNIKGSLGQILQNNFDLNLNNNYLQVVTYSTQNKGLYNKESDAEIIDIKNMLKTIGVNKYYIFNGLSDSAAKQTKPSYYTWHYKKHKLSELYLAVCINDLYTEPNTVTPQRAIRLIKLVSIDPIQEDIFKLIGRIVNLKDYLGDKKIPQAQSFIESLEKRNSNTAIQVMISPILIRKVGLEHYHKYYERIINTKEHYFYQRIFGKSKNEVVAAAKSNTLPFYSAEIIDNL